MTMQVRLERHGSWTITGVDYDNGDLKVIPGEVSFGLFLESEVTHPPSRQGKKVLIYVSPRDVNDLFQILKREAIRQRSKPMGA